MTVPVETVLILIAAVLGVFVAYSVLAPVSMNLSRFIRHPRVLCPVHKIYGTLRLNMFGAALSAGYGQPVMHVKDCSLLHPGEKCDEACLKDANF